MPRRMTDKQSASGSVLRSGPAFGWPRSRSSSSWFRALDYRLRFSARGPAGVIRRQAIRLVAYDATAGMLRDPREHSRATFLNLDEALVVDDRGHCKPPNRPLDFALDLCESSVQPIASASDVWVTRRGPAMKSTACGGLSKD